MVLLRSYLVTSFLTRHNLFFYFGLDFMKIIILTKIREDWIRTVPPRVHSWFY